MTYCGCFQEKKIASSANSNNTFNFLTVTHNNEYPWMRLRWYMRAKISKKYNYHFAIFDEVIPWELQLVLNKLIKRSKVTIMLLWRFYYNYGDRRLSLCLTTRSFIDIGLDQVPWRKHYAGFWPWRTQVSVPIQVHPLLSISYSDGKASTKYTYGIQITVIIASGI